MLGAGGALVHLRAGPGLWVQLSLSYYPPFLVQVEPSPQSQSAGQQNVSLGIQQQLFLPNAMVASTLIGSFGDGTHGEMVWEDERRGKDDQHPGGKHLLLTASSELSGLPTSLPLRHK
eukprot:scaffold121564_cov18-Tisochrysis_lutea.AAC.1